MRLRQEIGRGMRVTIVVSRGSLEVIARVKRAPEDWERKASNDCGEPRGSLEVIARAERVARSNHESREATLGLEEFSGVFGFLVFSRCFK